MAINIKNDEAERLARKVAERTGESLTDAIRISLRERLARIEDSEGRDERRLRLHEMARSIADQLGPYRSGMTTDDLYDDETGLPA